MTKTMYKKQKINIGDKVIIKGDHPWAGSSGEFIRTEETPWGKRPVVKLDNGKTCFVMKPECWAKFPND